MGNRSYGTILIDKLVADKSQPEASPCMHYFINKEGEAITQPEIFVPDRSPYLKPEEYWKVGESLRGNPSSVINKPTKEQLAEDIKTMSNEEIAKKYNLGKSTIGRYLTDYGLKRDDEYIHRVRSGVKNEGQNHLSGQAKGDCANRGNQGAEKDVLGGQCLPDKYFCTVCGDIIPMGLSVNNSGLCNSCFTSVNDAKLTVDDLPFTDKPLEGLAEAEPAWNVNLSNGAVDRLIKELKKPISDEEILQGIKEDIEELRERARRRANKEVMDRVLVLLGSKEVAP